MKALGTGMAEGVGWKQIEIVNDEKGKPHALLTARALELYEEMGGKGIDVSVSHCGDFAIAYAVIDA